MGKLPDLLPGTLEMLILKVVSLGPLHGYGVLLRIRQISNDVLNVEQGSLYPALYRLEHQGYIRSTWGTSDNNRRAKYYSLTRAGASRLRQDAQQWRRVAGAVASVMGAVPEEG